MSKQWNKIGYFGLSRSGKTALVSLTINGEEIYTIVDLEQAKKVLAGQQGYADILIGPERSTEQTS
jgi:hypothetical protein